jgi:hypothetical protein
MLKVVHGGSGSQDAYWLAELFELSKQLVSFDQINSVDKISVVKHDIEGFEVEALQGMAVMFKKSIPKISVCLYHRPEDFWEVPLLIKRLNPDYKVF